MVEIANHDKKESGLSALVGAAVGAVVAAGAIFLSDKKNRKKLSKKFNEVVDAGNEKLDEVSNKFDEVKNKGEKMLEGKAVQTKTKAKSKAKPKRVAKQTSTQK